ncbi:MAG TPA: histidine kinase dimerization/phosphoacceptor domain -containing protein [Ignavibacteriaceae bacterium]|nr:histidine kinase dimerization/phosphoacceptor domain -containing protein [Ignavibacteriaceae bacterium]
MALQLKTHIDQTKILLVDDKRESLIAIEAILEDEGYTFIRAQSAKEALKILLKEQDFSLILMDVNMPEINGFETAELIYKREKLIDIPIIFITAYDSDEENFFTGYKSGGIDYVCKPINPELLKIKVKIFIELFRKNRLLQQREKELRNSNNALEAQIKDRLEIENELRLRNMQLSDAQKLAHIGSWEWDILSDTITGSDEIYNIFEIQRNLKKFKLEDLLRGILPTDISNIRSAIAQSITNGKPFNLFSQILSETGQIKYINTRGQTIKNEYNEVIKIYGTSQDITEINKTKEQLRILNLLEKMLNEVYIFNENDFKLIFANEESLRNINYQPDELKNLTFPEILTEADEKIMREKTASLISGEKDKIILFDNIKRNDNSCYPVEIHIQLIDLGEKEDTVQEFSEKVFLAVVLDLTERKRTEHQLIASLKEKEILLKEIHHRVKNNLQIISSLLNLQKSTDQDNEVNTIINDCIARVRSMSMLHEKLYHSDTLGSINFISYIAELGQYLISTYKGLNTNIDLEINSSAGDVNMDMGIPLGLILNELISNSIKHAFRDRQEGIINIDFDVIDSDQFCLRFKDDGVGLPQNLDINNVQSLGMLLVKSLVSQLGGNMNIHSNSGTEYEIKFAKK